MMSPAASGASNIRYYIKIYGDTTEYHGRKLFGKPYMVEFITISTVCPYFGDIDLLRNLGSPSSRRSVEIYAVVTVKLTLG